MWDTGEAVDQDGNIIDFNINGQLFDSEGAMVGIEFQAHAHSLNDQLSPWVAGLSDDRFIVTWTSNYQDGFSRRWGVFGQQFSSRPWQITPSSPVIDENAGNLTFTISRASSTGAQTVYVSTTVTEGYANVGDYTGIKNQPLTFADGETSKTINVSIIDDGEPEPDETFGLIVQENASDSVDTYLANATFTIRNDDTAPTSWSIVPEVSRVDEKTGSIAFTIMRSSRAGKQSVYASTVTTEGYANDGDYVPLWNKKVTFADGEDEKTVRVKIKGDDVKEPKETFGLIVQEQASDPVSVFLAKAKFNIRNEDAPSKTKWSISPSSMKVAETVGKIKFIIERSKAKYKETVYVGTTIKKHTNDGDFIEIPSSPLTFKRGKKTKAVRIEILEDGVKERPETFGLLVSDPVKRPSSPQVGEAKFTIRDDDPTKWSIRPKDGFIQEDGGKLTFEITRPNSGKIESVYISTTTDKGFSNGSGKRKDYQSIFVQPLRFEKGVSTHKVKVKIKDDAEREGDEKFGVIVQSRACHPIDRKLTSAKFTIRDDDKSAGSKSQSLTNVVVVPAKGPEKNLRRLLIEFDTPIQSINGNVVIRTADGDVVDTIAINRNISNVNSTKSIIVDIKPLRSGTEYFASLEVNAGTSDSKMRTSGVADRKIEIQVPPAATQVSDGFRHPLGSGYLTKDNTHYYEDKFEGNYTAYFNKDGNALNGHQKHTGFFVPCGAVFGGNNAIDTEPSYWHLGEDWNGSGGGFTDLGAPVYAISNGEVAYVGGKDDPYYSALGKFLVLKHTLPSAQTINGKVTDEVFSIYAHLRDFDPCRTIADTGFESCRLTRGTPVSIGQTIGHLGNSGKCKVHCAKNGEYYPHLHFEIRTVDPFVNGWLSGYLFDLDDSKWSEFVDPTSFINDNRNF